jgi:hypothetical protein
VPNVFNPGALFTLFYDEGLFQFDPPEKLTVKQPEINGGRIVLIDWPYSPHSRGEHRLVNIFDRERNFVCPLPAFLQHKAAHHDMIWVAIPAFIVILGENYRRLIVPDKFPPALQYLLPPEYPVAAVLSVHFSLLRLCLMRYIYHKFYFR